jgi:hypothetical protein
VPSAASRTCSRAVTIEKRSGSDVTRPDASLSVARATARWMESPTGTPCQSACAIAAAAAMSCHPMICASVKGGTGRRSVLSCARVEKTQQLFEAHSVKAARHAQRTQHQRLLGQSGEIVLESEAELDLHRRPDRPLEDQRRRERATLLEFARRRPLAEDRVEVVSGVLLRPDMQIPQGAAS